jgi:hypothetical protein
MDIKEPTFDKPVGIGATGERRVVNPRTAPVKVGTRVMLVYQGNHMTAEVTAVEEPDSRFVGSVLEFEGLSLKHGDLQHGDLFRFNRRDLRWID